MVKFLLVLQGIKNNMKIELYLNETKITFQDLETTKYYQSISYLRGSLEKKLKSEIREEESKSEKIISIFNKFFKEPGKFNLNNFSKGDTSKLDGSFIGVYRGLDDDYEPYVVVNIYEEIMEDKIPSILKERKVIIESNTENELLELFNLIEE